jgi:hypothetical protein
MLQGRPAHRWHPALLVSLLCSFVGLGCSSTPENVGAVKADQIVIVKSKVNRIV